MNKRNDEYSIVKKEHCMKASFRTKLTGILMSFSLVMTGAVSFVDLYRQEESLKKGNEEHFSLMQDNITTSLRDADNAFSIFDKEVETNMKKYSDELVAKYEKDPDFSKWDFNKLKADFGGMDIYVIDEGHTITHSSFKADVGLDFSKDGKTNGFTDLLDSRRYDTKFTADSLDQETNTGKIKKYSYMPTKDHKFLIELGLYAENTELFNKFNFLNIVNDLQREYAQVDDVTVFNPGGKSVGENGPDGKSIQLAGERWDKVKEALELNDVVEMKGELKGKEVTYRYIPYILDNDGSTNYTDRRVIELVYNDDAYQEALSDNRTVFILQMISMMLVALLISYFVGKITARPIYLAFHDALTGLANRAKFEEELKDSLVGSTVSNTALMILDLDNFKKVNDTLGHDRGDYLLKDVARRLNAVLKTRPNSLAARLGGDEFTIILRDVKDVEEVRLVAQRVIDELKAPLNIEVDSMESKVKQSVDIISKMNVTASIGIAFAPADAEDAEGLYKKADLALYVAKNGGKNAYRLYDATMKESTGE